MGRKKKGAFWESAVLNNKTYQHYYTMLSELAISMFEWHNLPDSIDPRFLELTLFSDGISVFFEDEVMGYLALQAMINGQLNVYRIPTKRTAYATNGYNKELNADNSVIIYNNMLHTSTLPDIENYARRLYEIERTIDVNIKAQKTPIIVTCDENQRLTLINLYSQYDGNEPFIFGSKNLDLNALQAISTGAPFVADKLYQVKSRIWNDALTYLGIPNDTDKKERMLTDEINYNLGAVIMSRHTRLAARQEACKQINSMFGLNVTVDYRDNFMEAFNMPDQDELEVSITNE